MLKKPVQQGRRRAETGGVAFPPTQPRAVTQLFSRMGYVGDFDEPRTMLGERRVSTRQGRAGENKDFFSILLNSQCNLRPH
jgi:hypothetical protein